MREAFALQKLLTFFQQKKYWHIWNVNVWNFNVSLNNDVVSFEQLGPERLDKQTPNDDRFNELHFATLKDHSHYLSDP